MEILFLAEINRYSFWYSVETLLRLLHGLCNNEIQAGLMFSKEWKVFNNYNSKTAAKISSIFILIALVFKTDGLWWFYHSPSKAETHWKEKSPISQLLQESIGKVLYKQKGGEMSKSTTCICTKYKTCQSDLRKYYTTTGLELTWGQPFLYCLEIPCS